MANRVDFFRSQTATLALPGTAFAVHVEGSLCPCLEVVEVVRDGWPEFGRAKLRYNPAAAAANGEVLTAEQVIAEFDLGQSIRISRFYNGVYPDSAVSGWPIFCGQIEAVEVTIGETEQVEIIARDWSAQLERVTVGSGDFESGQPSYAEAIYALFSKYFMTGQSRPVMREQLRAIAGAATFDSEGLIGLKVKDAVHRLCDAAGIAYHFVPNDRGRNGHAVVFYRPGTGRKVELNCQRKGERLSVSRTDISDFSGTIQLNEAGGIDESFEVRTLYAAVDYQRGDIVTSGPQSRNIFGVMHDKSRICIIERVRMDIEKQCTELKIGKVRA